MNRDESLMIFSSGLLRFMSRNKYNCGDIAKIIGTKEANVSILRSGKSLPKFSAVLSLIDAGMSLDEVFGTKLASKLTEGFQMEQAKENPMETAQMAKKVLSLLLEQVEGMDKIPR